MTFDFAPEWMDALLRDLPLLTPAGPSPLHAAAAPPPHPDARLLGEVVRELFTEGTLSAEQFRLLSAAPDLRTTETP